MLARIRGARGRSSRQATTSSCRPGSCRAIPEAWAEQPAPVRRGVGAVAVHPASLAAAGVESHWIGQAVELEGGPLLPRRVFRHPRIRVRAADPVRPVVVSLPQESRGGAGTAGALRRRRSAARRPARAEGEEIERDAEEWAATMAARSAGEGGRSRSTRRRAQPATRLRLLRFAAPRGRFRARARRSDGAGAAAMGTGWSGNLDFMTDANSLLVRHSLVPLQADEYPYGRGSPGPSPTWTTPRRCWKGAGRPGPRPGDRAAGTGGRAAHARQPRGGPAILARLEAIVAKGMPEPGRRRRSPRRKQRRRRPLRHKKGWSSKGTCKTSGLAAASPAAA